MPFIRPDADIATGSWFSTPLWQKVDEVTFSDTDFVSSVPHFGIGSTNDLMELRLSNPTDWRGGFEVRDAGVWKRPTQIQVRDAGVWKTPVSIRIRDAGTWKWAVPDVTIRYRALKSVSGPSPTADLRVRLLQGTTVIDSITNTALTGSFATYTMSPTFFELLAISDADDLRLDFQAQLGGSDDLDQASIDLSWVELEYHD